MSRRKIIATIVVTLLSCGIAWWLLKTGRTPLKETENSSPAVRVVDSSSPEKSVTAKSPVKPAAPTVVAPPNPMATYDAINHKSIEFYGEVVDQDGASVVGATVYITVYMNSTGQSGLKRATTVSGSDGKFTVSGYSGRTLDIGLAKEGFEYAGDVGPFQYTDFVTPSEQHHPDPKRPVRFVMWKRQGPEPMIHNSLDIPLQYDGKEVRLDLVKGKVVAEGGDLVFRLSAPPVTKEETESQHAWDWDFEIEAVGGGLKRSFKKLMSLAPSEGYAAKINLGRKVKDEHWWGQAEGDYFVFTRNKLYSKCFFYFTGNPGLKPRPGVLMLRWETNPSGSRNLEYDREMDVTKQYQDLKK